VPPPSLLDIVHAKLPSVGINPDSDALVTDTKSINPRT
jgi:hypothetical protein